VDVRPLSLASRLALASLLLAAVLAAPAPAAAQSSSAPTSTAAPSSSAPTGPASPLSVPDPARPPSSGGAGKVTASEAKAIALRVPKIARLRDANPGSTTSARIKDGRWVVDLNRRTRPGQPVKAIGQVYVDRVSGVATEAWTGHQVAWTMARGYPGAFGRSVNSPWIWVTLCVLFVLPFVDVRRPLCWLHADLLAMLGFSVSLAFFNDANLGLSVPLTLPLLCYLLARLLWIGLGRGTRAVPVLRVNVPWPWLAGATLFLVGFRTGLNAVDGNVIDVGYAGVIGADKLAHARELWGAFPSDNGHGDTYGPLLYLAYVPFELIWPWSGSWDQLGAAHAATAVFDLACIGLLFLIGRRLGGTPLGVVLAYAWVTYPFTIFASNAGTNDALPAALVLAALLAHAHPLRRGALVAAAGMTKFAALALLPLFAAHGLGDRTPPDRRARRVLRFALGAGLVLAVSAALVFTASDPATFWDRTIGFQAGRDAPFSVWGFYGGGWEIAQRVVQAGAVLLAVLLPFARRRDDVVGLAALAGAVLVAFQAATTYWFYLYLVWVAPLALIAFLGRPATAPQLSPRAEREAAAARSSLPALAPSSG
jgi:hypothetical protein